MLRENRVHSSRPRGEKMKLRGLSKGALKEKGKESSPQLQLRSKKVKPSCSLKVYSGFYVINGIHVMITIISTDI